MSIDAQRDGGERVPCVGGPYQREGERGTWLGEWLRFNTDGEWLLLRLAHLK